MQVWDELLYDVHHSSSSTKPEHNGVAGDCPTHKPHLSRARLPAPSGVASWFVAGETEASEQPLLMLREGD